MMTSIADIVLSALSDTPVGHGAYAAALRAAFKAYPPPYGTRCYGEIYRSAAANPSWVATSLVAGAEREAEGARRLWALAASSGDHAVSAYVKQHAIDESRHARWYIATADLAFPGAIEAKLRRDLDRLSPRYTTAQSPVPDGSSYGDPTVDHFIQANLAEIRTWVNQKLQMPVLIAYCDETRRRRLGFLLDRLARDEIRHIIYTARLIEEFAVNLGQSAMLDIMTQRVCDLNEMTRNEVEDRVFPLHCSAASCTDGRPVGCPLVSQGSRTMLHAGTVGSAVTGQKP